MPDLIEQFAERAAEVIHDRNQAVMTAGITLMLAICEQVGRPLCLRLLRNWRNWRDGDARLCWAKFMQRCP